jgi:hypothetical protein
MPIHQHGCQYQGKPSALKSCELHLTPSQTVTSYTTNFNTKTYSTVTTIYNTKVESEVKSGTRIETVPVT